MSRSLRWNRSPRSRIVVLALVGMTGCGLLKKKPGDGDAAADAAAVADAADASAAAAAATAPAASAPIAANADAVARYPEEKPLDNVAATIQRSTNLREIPGVGKVVATVPPGTAVTQIAQTATASLVLFNDTKSQQTLMGWVRPESFTASTAKAKPVKAPTCKAPEIALIADAPLCGRVCTDNSGCPSGQACKGSANKLVGGKAKDAVSVCTVYSPPAPRPVAPAAADAGARPSPTPPGPTPPAPAPTPTPSAPDPTPPAPAPTPTTSSGKPSCPEDMDEKTARRANCELLPKTRRPNGMACHAGLQCDSQRCSGGTCKACASNAECGQSAWGPNVCKPSGRCSTTCMPSNERACQMGDDCCSGTCITDRDPNTNEFLGHHCK